MSPYRTIIKWITPSETRPVVTELFNQAQQVRSIKKQLQLARNEMDGTWTGGAHDTAIQSFDALLRDINNYANSLDAKAGQVASITVWIEVREWFEEITRPR